MCKGKMMGFGKTRYRRPLSLKRSIQGQTLIELMVALTIGMLLIASVSATFEWTNSNFSQDQGAARMQENARYAIEDITKDLQMSDFLFNVVDETGVQTALVNNKVNSDCGTTGTQWVISLDKLVDTQSQQTTSNISTAHSCINSANLHTVGNTGSEFTDVLIIKRVKPPTTTLETGKMYLQTTKTGGARLILHNNSANPASGDAGYVEGFDGATYMEYSPVIYYVGKGEQADSSILQRKSLSGINDGSTNTLNMETEEGGIAENIEYFHVMWGIDEEMIDGIAATAPDGNPNFFVSTPTAAQQAGIIAAKIFVLVKNGNIDGNYLDDKQYTLGDVTVPPNGTFNDKYKRKVFSSTVMLRNRTIRNNLDLVFNQ